MEYARHRELADSPACTEYERSLYQGLLLGLCAILNNRYQVRSNRESGLGRFDICLLPLSSDLPGFIFELKATKNTSEDLDSFVK